MMAIAFDETAALEVAPVDDTCPLVLAATPSDDASSLVAVEHYYVEVGDQLRDGSAVCLLRSERYAFDLPARQAGIVQELLVQPGTMVAPGEALLRIMPGVSNVAEVIQALPPGSATTATPLARSIASVHDLELTAIQGTGPGGRIRAVDVRALLPDETGPVLDGRLPDLVPIRASLAPEEPLAAPFPAGDEPRSSALSSGPVSLIIHGEQPFALTAIEVDLPDTTPSGQSDPRLAQRRVQITAATYIAHAAVAALIDHPWLNSAWTDEGVIVYGRVDLGILVHLDGVLRLTIVERAADLSVQGLAWTMAIAPPATTRQPTFTIMPLATGTGWWSEPVNPAGSAAVLGIGHPMRRPVVLDAEAGPTLAVRDRVLLTLAYDARHITHSEADAFLSSLRHALRPHAFAPTKISGRLLRRLMDVRFVPDLLMLGHE